MDVTRKTSSPVPANADDQEDWDLEILQAMVSPSTAEDAALACAAAWMNFVRADRVAVAIFDSTTSCIVAHGQRDDSHLTIYVGREKASVASLMRPDLLFGANGPCVIENPDQILCWPEHLSVVMAKLDEDTVEEERIDLIQDVSRKLLSRWTTPITSFANPAHMEAMAEFAAGAGHEINNPLGSIIGQAQLLLKREDRADHRQALETIGAQAWRIRDMIGDTMLFARPPQPEFLECDLIQTTHKVVTNLNSVFGGKDDWISLNSTDQAIAVFADRTQISTMINNLLRNACEAVLDNETDRRIAVTVRREADYAVIIDITDNGPPIPVEIRRHLFDPFFSGRQAGRGLGFGLSHCWQIVRMHNGILTQEPMETGNRFHVVLPVQ